MIKILKIAQTCAACPSQWEAYTPEGDYIYIRYRWGHLGITMNEEPIYGKQISSNHYDGTMDFEKLKSLTNHLIDWSEIQVIEEMELFHE